MSLLPRSRVAGHFLVACCAALATDLKDTPASATEGAYTLAGDTGDLLAESGVSFLFPAGWMINRGTEGDGIRLACTSPQVDATLAFAMESTDSRLADKDVIDRYWKANLERVSMGAKDFKVLDDQALLLASSQAVSEGRRLIWIIPSMNEAGATLIGVDGSQKNVFMLHDFQTIQAEDQLHALELAMASLYVSSSPGNARYTSAYTRPEFRFGYPSGTTTVVREGSTAGDGSVTLTGKPDLQAEFAWLTSDEMLDGHKLEQCVLARWKDRPGSGDDIHRGALHLGEVGGRYWESGNKVVLAAWQSRSTKRIYLLRLETAEGLRILILQRFLLSFREG